MTTFTEIIIKKAGNNSTVVSHPSGSSFDNGSTSIVVNSVTGFPTSGYISAIDTAGLTQVLRYESTNSAFPYKSFGDITGWKGTGDIEHGASIVQDDVPFTEVSIT